jgi:acetolactate synthase-1/2/3 large subunit
MNGGEALIRGLVGAGVDVCFANPGTSEMHMVQAMDGVGDMRGVLCLFEGVCTGAADGYARMRGTPACTLLHLGAGLGNGIANLHNARRASTPVINLVGDHARDHVHFDAPLTSNVKDIARGVSAWIRSSATPEGMGQDARDAVAASLAANPESTGNVATLIVPADCAWGNAHAPQGSVIEKSWAPIANDGVIDAVDALSLGGPNSILLLDGNGLSAEGVTQAGRIAKATGCRVYATTFPARVESGPGLYPVQRMPYFPEDVMGVLASAERLVLAGAKSPVSFFAYQKTPSDLVPEGCDVVRLAHKHQDVKEGLKRVAEALGAQSEPDVVPEGARPSLPKGALNTARIGEALAALIPENSIVSTDSGGGGASFPILQQAVRHSFLAITGGSIGQGGPVALGAAVACPDRPVFALLGDGGAMYTNQYLWTAAREKLDIVTIVYANRTYSILDTEYHRLGVNTVGDTAASMFSLDDPSIDWVSLAAGYGVPGARVATSEDLVAALQTGMATEGPYLIEAAVTGRD